MTKRRLRLGFVPLPISQRPDRFRPESCLFVVRNYIRRDYYSICWVTHETILRACVNSNNRRISTRVCP